MNIRRILSTVVLAAAAASGASADTIAYVSNVVGPAITEVNYTLILPRFDGAALAASIGASSVTLTGVELYFAAAETTNIGLQNTSNGPITFDARADVNLTRNFANSATAADKFFGEDIQVFDTGTGNQAGGCQNANPGTPAPGTCAQITVASGQTNTYNGITVSNTDAAYGLSVATGQAGLRGVTRAGTAIANYTGSNSTFTLSGSTFNFIGTGGAGGNITATQTANATFRAEVDYSFAASFAATPEPATMALLGGGLILLGLWGKRMKR